MDNLTGYDTEDRYLATRFIQGGREVFSLELGLDVAASTLPRPDPLRPMPGNRRVNEKHARSFGDYVRNNAEWVAPALLLRGPNIFNFTVEKEIAGVQFGVVGIPRLSRTDLRILDGQHRILGLNYAVEDIARELEDQRNLLAAARRQENDALVAQYEGSVRDLELQRARMHNERVAIQVFVENELKKAEQMFDDVAANALGITSAIRVRFDDRKVVNRCLDEVLNHALLKDRVDMEQDRIGAQSVYLLGAKHVADIIRTVAVGISGRIGKRLEFELRESALIEDANSFLDTLVAAFSDLESVVEGRVSPAELRRRSLLGSTTMLRVLAGAFHDLRQDLSEGEIQDHFTALEPVMAAPVPAGSPWIATGAIAEKATAPGARNQEMKELATTIARWGRTAPDWLRAGSSPAAATSSSRPRQ